MNEQMKKSCLKCVHHIYEENSEEVEVFVCFLRRKLIAMLEAAEECLNYYRGLDE